MAKNTRGLILGVLALVPLGFAPFAAGQSARPLGVRIPIGDWTLVPIVQGGAVHSFLATRDPVMHVGENLRAVWYVRSPAASWSSYAWIDADAASACASVKVALGISSTFDSFRTALPAAAPQSAEPDVGGVVASDPLAGVIAEAGPERESIVESLVAIGYAAASVPLSASGCDEEQTLAALAEAIESTGCQEWSASCEQQANATLAAACAGLCWPTTICDDWQITSPGTWTVGAWVFESSRPLTGGGVECHYKRTVSRPRHRNCTHVSITCTVTTTSHTATESFEQKIICQHDSLHLCPVAPGCSDANIPPTPRPGIDPDPVIIED